MSYTEVHSLLKLGKAGEHRFQTRLGHGGRTWVTETQIVRQVDFHHGVSVVFWFDRITDQCRVFADATMAEIDGKLVMQGGLEIQPSELN